VGTTYGNQVSFTTLSIIPPTVTTTAVTNITQTTATSGGSVTADGGATVTARGVCWSTTSSPTIANSHTTDGSGTGTFVSNLTGLTANTLYYVRAYATNSAGTTYGNEVTFTTLSAWQCGDTIQYSGQTYNTVLIGTQCWTEQNLNVGTMIPGTQNQTNNSIIEKYCYHDSVSNCTVYGGLYMWNEMMQYSTSSGAQGICPSGWHIPTDNDWCSLATFLDPSINCNTSALNTNNAGGQMKESGTNHWNPPNTGATNSSGFTALGGGRKNLGNYWFYLKQVGEFWTSNLMDSSDPYFYSMDYNFAGIARGWQTINNSTSVRCIKN
jgi:uncharacterized protein (TIGR02145 family)